MFYFKELYCLILVFFILNACTPVVFNSSDQYFQYISNETNGLTQKTGNSEVLVVVKHIPPQMRVIQDVERDSELNYSIDSLLTYYSNSLTFIVTLKPTDKCRVRDLRYFNIGDEAEYNSRQKILHHGMAQNFTLALGSKKLHPQLCHLEQDYASGGNLTFILVFAANEELHNDFSWNKNTMTLHFADPFFEVLEAKFEFSKNDLLAIPQLKI